MALNIIVRMKKKKKNFLYKLKWSSSFDDFSSRAHYELCTENIQVDSILNLCVSADVYERSLFLF